MLRLRLHFLLIGLLVVAACSTASLAAADDRSGIESFEDNRNHWLFEFEVASDKQLGTQEDAASIAALVRKEGRRTFKGAHPGRARIRWKSASVAIAKEDLPGSYPLTHLLCVCEKREDVWKLLYVYRSPSAFSHIK